jgi:AcrR family transcriptional regulator
MKQLLNTLILFNQSYNSAKFSSFGRIIAKSAILSLFGSISAFILPFLLDKKLTYYYYISSVKLISRYFMANEPRTRHERIQRSSRQRRDEEKQELRQLIIATAAELFLKNGYEHFSLRQVAEIIGYSPTTIYLYFKDKDDLLFNIVYEGFVLFERQMLAAVEQLADPMAQLVALGKAYLKFGHDHPNYYRMLFVQRPDFLTTYAASKDVHPRIGTLDLVEKIVQEAIRTGKMRPGEVQVYTRVIWSCLHGLVSLSINLPDIQGLGLNPFDLNQDGDILLDLFQRGLA